MLWLLLLMSSAICSMDRQPSEIVHSPYGVSSEDDDSLCDSVLHNFHPSRSMHFDQRIKPKLRAILREHNSSNREAPSPITDDIVRDMVQRATQDAIEELDRKIQSKFSKKQTTMIATGTTLITAIIAVVVDSYTCKR